MSKLPNDTRALRVEIASVPHRKIEAGTVWHSWDGYEWWSGEPDEVTRSLTLRRVVLLATLAAFAPNHAHPGSGVVGHFEL